MLLEEITKLVGDFPSGYDALFYVCGVIVLLYLLDCFYGLLRMLAGHYLG
ncbi:MAG: hypothetical protein HFG62_06025 [Lachnospiraceae bacterium]|jgi:hypothetical protein|nr:hypothetical protein [Lachnospiraceae bacterium]